MAPPPFMGYELVGLYPLRTAVVIGNESLLQPKCDPDAVAMVQSS